MLVFRVAYLAYLLRLFLIGGLFGGGFFTRVLVRFGGKSCWWQRHKQYKSRAEKRTPKSSNEKRTPGRLLVDRGRNPTQLYYMGMLMGFLVYHFNLQGNIYVTGYIYSL